MRADATITLGRVDNALAVPIQAVFSEGMVRFVYVPRGSKFVRVPVQIGRRSELYAEVTAGIESGTSVLIREPSPAEVISEPWRPEQLKAVGLEMDDGGAVVPIGGMQALMGANRPSAPTDNGAGPGAGTPGAPPAGGQGERGPRGGGRDGQSGARPGAADAPAESAESASTAQQSAGAQQPDATPTPPAAPASEAGEPAAEAPAPATPAPATPAAGG
jgi:hypothetical protein